MNETPLRNATTTLNSTTSCWERLNQYHRESGYNYRVLTKEIESNINMVSTTVSGINSDLNWKNSSCLLGKDGHIQYNFTVTESKFRKYSNMSIDLPFLGAATTLLVPYFCYKGRAIMPVPTLTLRTNIAQPLITIKQNKTFTCFGTAILRVFFCFSNRTTSVRYLYRSIGGFHHLESHYPRRSETIYSFSEFNPPVEVARMYFILSGIHAYNPPWH